MKAYKNLRKIIETSILAGSLALAGCANPNNHFVKEGEFRGYPTKVGITTEGRRITIYPDHLNSEDKLTAVDTNNDGRFDGVYLRNLRKGHPLEKYANLDSLKTAYDAIVKND